MADIRIKVAKDKAKLVKALRTGEGSTGLFQTYYEVLVFAAALGAKRGKFIPIKEGEFSKEIDPIRQEQFSSKGYDQIINLIAVTHNKNPRVLSATQEDEEKRISIFESYINGGLELLEDVVKGSNDISKQIFLLLLNEKNSLRNSKDDIFDLNFL